MLQFKIGEALPLNNVKYPHTMLQVNIMTTSPAVDLLSF